MLYQKVLKPILFKFDPEEVHNRFVDFGEFAGRSPVLKRLISFFYGYRGPDISKTVDGLTYKTPFLLSAGFDYNARLLGILPRISFGGVEVGSVTARPCSGNEKPRLTRLIKSRSILVNKGLLNDGVEQIIKRIKNFKKPQGFMIGVSIARCNDEASASVEAGIDDYFYSFKRLNEEDVGDYYALNISCPNAYGGESFTDPNLLQSLLLKLSYIKCQKPVYLKMPINLDWPDFNKILNVASKFEMIKGVIIGNLNKDYGALDFRDEAPGEYRGGLSGKPCADISNELIRQTKSFYKDRFTIIGCGGVLSPEDAAEKMEAGADLIALITGMIFNGPGFVKELARWYSKSV